MKAIILFLVENVVFFSFFLGTIVEMIELG